MSLMSHSRQVHDVGAEKHTELGQPVGLVVQTLHNRTGGILESMLTKSDPSQFEQLEPETIATRFRFECPPFFKLASESVGRGL
jgi:hypothetical protein